MVLISKTRRYYFSCFAVNRDIFRLKRQIWPNFYASVVFSQILTLLWLKSTISSLRSEPRIFSFMKVTTDLLKYSFDMCQLGGDI